MPRAAAAVRQTVGYVSLITQCLAATSRSRLDIGRNCCYSICVSNRDRVEVLRSRRLMRLEQGGFIRGTWRMAENTRKARFYGLTPAGTKQLAIEKHQWESTVAVMQAMLAEPS